MKILLKRWIIVSAISILLVPIVGCGPKVPAGSDNSTNETVPTRVEPVRSAEESAKMINNRPAGPMKVPETEKATVYQPDGSWTFSHGPIITYFKDKFYVMFSNGRENEDDCGQRVMISSSSDGLNWSKPKPLVDSIMGEHSELVLQATGFLVNGDTLTAFYRSGEYPAHKLRGKNLRPVEDGTINHKNHALATTDRENWTDAGTVTFGRGGFGITKSGRIISAGPPIFPYTDDPSGVGEYHLAVLDMSNIQARGANMLTESCMYQTDDYILHMMFRTDTGYIWASESYDDGETWTEPYPTEFTNDTSKFWFGRLPDGRFYCVSNPIMGSNRNPLVLSLSSDGFNFSDQYLLRHEPYELQYPGMYKGGVYGYPHAIVEDGYMYVVYSKHKEVIEVTRIALSELGA